MRKYEKPTKEEVREWMKERQTERRLSPPNFDEIRERLWSKERLRKPMLT